MGIASFQAWRRLSSRADSGQGVTVLVTMSRRLPDARHDCLEGTEMLVVSIDEYTGLTGCARSRHAGSCGGHFAPARRNGKLNRTETQPKSAILSTRVRLWRRIVCGQSVAVTVKLSPT